MSSLKVTIPVDDIVIASVVDVEPIVPPSATVNPPSPDTTTVPDVFGNVIVLSAVGSTTVNVVSKPSSVAPSNTIVPSSFTFNVVAFVVVVLRVV